MTNLPIIAKRTLAEITQAIAVDNGARFRQLEGETIRGLEDAFDPGENDELRSHLGASVIGNECLRATWYGWRWAARQSFNGTRDESATENQARMLRLWNRGHIEEGRFMAMLRLIGVQIYQYDSEHRQFRVGWWGGHFGGSGDGVLVGVPDLPAGMPCLGEFKTHGLKSFTTLLNCGGGVREAKRTHFEQMQVYMRGFGLEWALYFAVCKDNDKLYAELVKHDESISSFILQRAQAVIFSDKPLPRIRGASPSFFACKMCDFRKVCYHTIEPLHHCRTCKFSLVLEDGRWGCAKHQVILTKEAQKVGCGSYEKMKGLK